MSNDKKLLPEEGETIDDAQFKAKFYFEIAATWHTRAVEAEKRVTELEKGLGEVMYRIYDEGISEYSIDCGCDYCKANRLILL